MPPMPPGVVFVLSIMALVIVGTIVMVIYKIAARPTMSSSRVRSVPLQPNYDRRFSAVSSAEINDETSETAPTPAETEAEKIAFAENYAADVIARLILADELDLTKAVKIGFGKKSGEGYQKYSRLTRAAMERQQPTTPIAGRPTTAEFIG